MSFATPKGRSVEWIRAVARLLGERGLVLSDDRRDWQDACLAEGEEGGDEGEGAGGGA